MSPLRECMWTSPCVGNSSRGRQSPAGGSAEGPGGAKPRPCHREAAGWRAGGMGVRVQARRRQAPGDAAADTGAPPPLPFQEQVRPRAAQACLLLYRYFLQADS